ncbi:class III lanthipeptide [Bifidobacterium catenulatum]
MKWILELQQLLLPEEEPDDGGSTISIAFVCKKESTISLLFCMDR